MSDTNEHEMEPQLKAALQGIIPPEELRVWLSTPNTGFQGEKPLELIQKGERDRIWAMIHQTRIGAYS